MQQFILKLAMAAGSLTACNSSSNDTAIETNKDSAKVSAPVATADTTVVEASTAFPAKEIIAGYLQVKNAFTKDDSKGAATAGNALATLLTNATTTSLVAEKQKTFADLQDDMKEHAEHIGTNPGKIAHQREHFIMLSSDMADFIKTFGNAGQILYKDHCPMANDGKGANWISEVKEIHNPYLGAKMPSCGTVKATIQ
ncbi:MAG: DUF3347 domain-containing protein [Ferruginibacter sp.]